MVQEGALHYTALAHQAYHDTEGAQHIFFVPDDHEDDRHLTDTEQSTTAAFPEATGDDAVSKPLAGADPRTAVTAQQARAIGISPTTAAKLGALLQWTQGQLEAASDRCTEDPSTACATELRNCRRRALAARDVARGRRPLAVLELYRAPLDGHGTDRLFTPDEVEQAQLHFGAASNRDPRSAAGMRAEPQDLCSVNSVITSQQAQ